MEIIKPQINLSINKTELNALIAEALTNPETAIAIKRNLAPLLEGSFPQFPEFTNITLGDTEEDGSTTVILKQPRQASAKADTPVQSIEPLVVNDSVEVEDTPTTVSETPAYVDPTA